MICKIFLVGEGKHDIGDLSDVPQYRTGAEGFLQPLLRRLAGEVFTLNIDGLKLSSFPKRRILREGAKRSRQAAQALELAADNGCHALVYVCDLDKESGESASSAERRRKRERLMREINEGFERARRLDNRLMGVKAHIAIPCRMIESWALGGLLGAVAASLGSTSPEDLWGDEDDPDSNHPKRALARHLGRRYSATDMADIANSLNIEALKVACPDSFLPFAESARTSVDSCIQDLAN